MQTFEMELGGRKLVIEQGKMAKQANGAVLVRYGDTVVLVTATASKEPREGVDFFPLTVDYEEKMYAAGKIPGGFIKREGRPSSDAILCARLIDRPIRPLFPKGFRNAVQIVATVLSVEPDNAPELLGMLGASAALTISDIPFMGPIAGVRVGRVDDEFVINPTEEQRKVSTLNLTVAGSQDAVMMVEAGASELPEDVILDAIMFGHAAIKKLVAFQKEIQAACGKEKTEPKLFLVPEELRIAVHDSAAARLDEATRHPDTLDRDAHIAAVKADTVEHFLTDYPEQQAEIEIALHDIEKEVVRHMITKEKIRPDGRAIDEVRPISCEVGLLPRTHGSGLFTRGQTQVLTVTTLGPLSHELIIDGLGAEQKKHYIHHYNFPGYCVGEARPMRSPGRREIGHGALAERALLPVIPTTEEFPYTIRLVSEVLESNGSSSQASVCGSTLSLMDAGVPIKRPVSGIAMGLVKDGEDYTILTDIQGMEDALGDMDFKVAGTERGVTAPRMETIQIPVDKIRDVIGTGGKVIHGIIDVTGCEIDIEEDGSVYIASTDAEGMAKAKQMIEDITRDVEVGQIYTGVVTRLMKFGAFVKILPNKEGLCHISQLANHRVEKVEDVVAIGDQLEVKVVEIDDKGRINLSHKAVLQEHRQ